MTTSRNSKHLIFMWTFHATSMLKCVSRRLILDLFFASLCVRMSCLCLLFWFLLFRFAVHLKSLKIFEMSTCAVEKKRLWFSLFRFSYFCFLFAKYTKYIPFNSVYIEMMSMICVQNKNNNSNIWSYWIFECKLFNPHLLKLCFCNHSSFYFWLLSLSPSSLLLYIRNTIVQWIG